MEFLLSHVEVRVLGALMEKEAATPDYYPLSLNALCAACNQKTNRDPVMSLDEDRVLAAIESLRAKGLALDISGAEHRVHKYGAPAGRGIQLRPPRAGRAVRADAKGSRRLSESCAGARSGFMRSTT